MHVIVLPWFLPKLAVKIYTAISLAIGVALSRVGLHAPYILDEFFGPNGSISSVALPIRDYLQIVEAAECHTTAGTDGGNVTLTIEKLTGTQAPAGGANMFKTSTFNLKAAINTPQRLLTSQLSGLSTAQAAAQLLSPGDRVCLTFGGVLTTLAGVGVVVVFKRTRMSAVR